MKYYSILLLLILCSCGTRKTETTKTDNINIENTYSQGAKIILGNTFTYKPFNALKPMQINGKMYNNVIISNDKSKTIEKWKNRNITKTIVIEKTKATKKTDYTILYIGLFAVLILGILAWFKLPKIKV